MVPRSPQLKFNHLFNEHFPCFFLKYFVHKNTRGGDESLSKNCTKDSYAYWTCCSRLDLLCARILALRGFLQHLPAKYKWRPKKSYYLSVDPWHCTIWQIRRWLLHYIHKKFRRGPEIATFRTKTLDFTLVIHLNWLEKIELRGCAWFLSILFIVKNCYTQRC